MKMTLLVYCGETSMQQYEVIDERQKWLERKIYGFANSMLFTCSNVTLIEVYKDNQLHSKFTREGFTLTADEKRNAINETDY